MRHAHRAIRLVDVLAAGATRTHGVDTHVLCPDINVDILSLGQHCNRCSRRMNAPARFRCWNALHPVHTTFEFQPRENALPGDRYDNLAVSAKIAFRN